MALFPRPGVFWKPTNLRSDPDRGAGRASVSPVRLGAFQILGRLLPWFAATLAWTAAGAAAETPAAPAVAAPRILVLNSYHPGYNWSDGEQAALLGVLVETRPELLPAVEYLDWRRYPDLSRGPKILEQLEQKYGRRHFDLVVALDEPALDLVLVNRVRFGADVPVVFGGINDADPAVLGRHPKLTGVAQTYDFGRTLDLITRLQPRLKKLIVVHCQSESGLATRRAFERHLAAHPAPWPLEWKDDNWSGAELLVALERLPADSAVLLLSMFRDRDGRVLADDGEFGRELARRSAGPVYFVAPPIVRHFGDASWANAVWPGVGGSLLAPDLHGEAVAKLALRVLAGEAPENIPIVERSPSRLAVRHEQMERFGLPAAALPADAVVFGRPAGLYAQHRTTILVAGGLSAVLGGIIASLLWLMLTRRRAVRALRENRASLEIAQHVARLGSWGVEVETRRAEWSNEMYRLFDLPPEQGPPVFEDFLGRLHPDDRALVRTTYLQAKAASGRSTVEFRRLVAGETRHYFATLLPEANADGAIVRVRGTVQDITRRKEMEGQLREHDAELQRLNRELEHRVEERTAQLAAKNKELESFTYAVSHDLKAPLRGVDGYSRLLLEDHAAALDDEGKQFLVNVRNAADQMGRLIDDLLTYSKLERRAVEQTTVDPAAVVADLLGAYAAEIATRGAIVNLTVPCVSLVADPHGLQMALRNLIDNALKFTRQVAVPVLAISGEIRGDRFVLAVRDNGPGFDPKFSERIFEIFQRLHRAEDYPGTGVGLAIVRKAMERMGGRAWAASTPGQGAEFFLEFPFGPPPPAAPFTATSHPATPR